MSAIYGIIDFTRDKIELENKKFFRAAYDNYKIDRYETITDTNLLFGCEIQYISPYSNKEQLPFYDEDEKLFFTADAVLSNHKELAAELSMDPLTPDGMLIYRSYVQWGKECIEHLVGNFSFAVYDKEKNVAYLATDHVSSRCLYFHYSSHKLYFSTIVRPIQQILHFNPSMNNQWILQCASLNLPLLNLKPDETPYNNIYRMSCAAWITITENSIKQEQYWNPVKNRKTLHLKSDTEYQQRFLDVMNKIIGSSISSSEEVGILLSSGLDSPSIACTAAPILDSENKRLYSYTSIPVPDYKKDCSDYFITDETEGVNCICWKYPNIIPSFCDYANKNALTAADELVSILETPLNANNNIVWENELLKLAESDHCRIVLNGQTGNTTVSYGNMLTYLNILLTHGHLYKFYKELTAIAGNYHMSRKKILKTYKFLLKQTLKYRLHITSSDEIDEDTCIKQSISASLNNKKQVSKMHYSQNLTYLERKKEIYQDMFAPLSYAQMGELQTKFGLKYGLLLNDPFTDKRMIEFCLSLPISCYVGQGAERRLIRVYMKHIVPDEILNNVYHRGLQSADSNYRYSLKIDEYKTLIRTELENSAARDFVDQERLNQFLLSIHDLSTEEEQDHFRHLCNLFSISRFINRFNE